MPSPLPYGRSSRQLNLSVPEHIYNALDELRWEERAPSLPALVLDMVVKELRARGFKVEPEPEKQRPGKR